MYTSTVVLMYDEVYLIVSSSHLIEILKMYSINPDMSEQLLIHTLQLCFTNKQQKRESVHVRIRTDYWNLINKSTYAQVKVGLFLKLNIFLKRLEKTFFSYAFYGNVFPKVQSKRM